METEVEFPKYTMDDFFYYKHYSFNHCVSISIINNFASVSVTHNNNGKNLFDEEITEDEFNRVLAEASELLMPELQPKQEDHYRVMAKASELLMPELQQKQEETI